MSAASAAKADALVEKGEKKITGFKLFGKKYDEAIEMFQQAANLYKLSKLWQQAGDTFVKIADLQRTKMDSPHEAALAFQDAANAYKKVSTSEAVICLEQAVGIFTELGKFGSAAKFQKNIGEILESENELEKAIDAYQAAADFFSGEEATSSANQCLLKVAYHAASLEKYERAIEVFEQVASASLDVNLLKWSVKDYFFCALICHLCVGDMVSTERAIEKYEDSDPNFHDSREAKLIHDLIDACKAFDVQKFTDATFDYDAISKLDQWKTSLLLRVKNNLGQEDLC
mmetsp:Transcript_29506/g.76196  ORF Transcript_29506/g.76196 Transcript_29506/m.76196 type:complete len:287 (-) Transcript_29506:1427-2287(-)|eukprot:CAMPEP_0113876698 /NCGR_PEP_ID=MMETSP0780_2-20120614/5636_1 /TAXON_ID=652834 /ORGANISM="Palpitomonas bilix" /LENGTH=286 /DNA_ID=CAMNT_0000862815 /DNA_START=94 /DNA_END=954 /DNA_ORIENTATION=- /assembly_acc=CAM_ASM_000599